MNHRPRNFLTIGLVTALASACLAAGLAESASQPKDAGNPKPGSIQPIPPSMEKERPAASLKVGDAAPPIKIDEWVKGDPVAAFEKGKVYVVEFWATWCPPCRAAIPHLTKLQRQYKDATVIGVTGSERKPESGPDNRLDNLRKFVKDQGDSMDYRVAYDSDREMMKDWMEAAGRNGIPAAFIVGGDGHIAWIGHPSKLDEPLGKAVEESKQPAKPARRSTTKPEPKPGR